MADNRNSKSDGALAAFELMLDTLGGDAARWPADRRAAAAELLQRLDATGTAARQSLAEARALDRALAAAPALDSKRISALASRIAVEAKKTAATSNVVTLEPAKRSPRVAVPSVRPSISRGWMTAAMLAASLLIGVVIGPGNTGLPVLRDAADAIGLGGYVDQLALAPIEDFGSADEDVL